MRTLVFIRVYLCSSTPPGGNRYRSGYLGNFGGNMDYNQLREGATVYLPV
jgi:acetamidase/formamidase